jgi:metal-responsive CopG/Arc/MetJ family transcriptional regulator
MTDSSRPRVVFTRLTEQELAELDYVALLEQRKRADLIRRAIQHYVGAYKKLHNDQQKPSTR